MGPVDVNGGVYSIHCTQATSKDLRSNLRARVRCGIGLSVLGTNRRVRPPREGEFQISVFASSDPKTQDSVTRILFISSNLDINE